MTKIKFGAIVTDGRGKLGGHVLAKNRSGNYMRTKVTPVNPQTPYQQAQRASLGTLSSGWSGLTQPQRNAWDGAVSDFQKTDIFGDLRTPTGKNLFTALNKNLLNSGQSIINLPPVPSTIPNLTIASATFSVGAGTYNVVTAGVATGSFVQLWATPAMSPGTSFVKNRIRLLETVAGAPNATIDVAASYLARNGALTAGANVYVAIRVINAGGEAGVLSTFKVSVIA